MTFGDARKKMLRLLVLFRIVMCQFHIGYKIRLKNRFVLAPSLRLSGFDLRTISIGWYAITAEPNRCTVKHDYFGFNVRDIQ